MFSPYYAWSGWRDPLNHCAINVALYKLDGGGAWAMTERGQKQLRRDATTLEIGPSAVSWDGEKLTARIDEITAPIPSRLRGHIRLSPTIVMNQRFPLDAEGRHTWQPIAPRARVEVAFDSPDVRWSGEGYFDSNSGVEPLQDGFRQWTWARAHLARDVGLFYDAERRDGTRQSLALRVDHAGAIEPVAPPPMAAIARTGWGLERQAWRDGDRLPGIRKTLEDTPFYARTALEGAAFGERAAIMHESLSLDRLRSPVVRAMLPFRMPRIVGRR